MTVTRRTREALADYRARRDMTQRLADELRLPPETVQRNIATRERLERVGVPLVVLAVFAVIVVSGVM